MKKLVTAALTSLFLSSSAYAAAVIQDGNIMLGVDDFGQLNIEADMASPVEGTTEVGLRYLPTGNESTSHGCLCEGWGVGIGESSLAGFANNDDGGATGLTLESFTSDATTATSVVTLNSIDPDPVGVLRITHSFALAAETDDLYRVMVTIENISGSDIGDLRYRRTFDWDIEPTAFAEVVSIGGTATATAVIGASTDGFISSDPFVGDSYTGDGADFGPGDIGSNFDFGFGVLLAGETFSFDIFYGAAANEAGIFAALGAVGAEVYSMGQAACDPEAGGTGCGDNLVNPFVFAFKGVGGDPIGPGPSPVPLPAPALLLLSGIAGLGVLSRRKRRS